MQKITTFLGFTDQAEEAAKLYTSIFRNSRIVTVSRYGDAGPMPKGMVMSVIFELEGQRFHALNFGPAFGFAPGPARLSLFVSCETQAEVDELWEKLSAGGQPGQCGWLTDRFGVAWQIVPSVLGELIGGKDPAGAKRAMQAMLQMTRLDIAALRRAYDGA
jgi:predicted 3-demethylubiquinone-9 3-methyltransferase (glyoxalase superfamily)